MSTDNMKWDEVLMKIQEGDILTSKKGFLSKSPLSGEWFIYWKVRYNGNGCFVIEGNKNVIEINQYTDKMQKQKEKMK